MPLTDLISTPDGFTQPINMPVIEYSLDNLPRGFQARRTEAAFISRVRAMRKQGHLINMTLRFNFGKLADYRFFDPRHLLDDHFTNANGYTRWQISNLWDLPLHV